MAQFLAKLLQNRSLFMRIIMLKQSLIFLSLTFFLSYVSQAQDDAFTTKAKPKTDTSARKKGFLGGAVDLQSDLLKPGQKISDIKKDLKGKLDKNKEALKELEGDVSDLGLKAKKDVVKKKKKISTTEYEGLKMTRVVSSYGNGNNVVTEDFYVIDEDAEPSVYASEVRWYDYKQRRTVTTAIKDKNYAQVLHGPYKRYVGEDLVEEGSHYLGTKDGRWERYGKETDQDWVLLDKQYYWRGFAGESEVSFYDKEKEKVKEVNPITFKKRTGSYYYFYDGGQKRTEGRFDDSVRVGVWREYYQFGTGSRTKRVIQYPKDKYDKTPAFVAEEYSDRGQQTFKGQKEVD
jgi:hypothetical protein